MAFVFENNKIIHDVILITPQVFWDERWFFMETYNKEEFVANWIDCNFVLDGHSRSQKWVLRWFHFQIMSPQAKLVRAVSWSVLDFAIDIRKSSSTYGQYISEFLSAENKRQLFIPKWFAHGFLVLEESTELLYKLDDFYNAKGDAWISYNDSDLDIDWDWIMKKYSIKEFILSAKDKAHPKLSEFYSANPF